ncbi:predicted protein [Sclerotinia sclerotiorum 1980 UF-70]|uniref:Uncharacterized protein n=1 Tax=Sclerotinia sclerotiorum (strain ATCC 18683 / 1980 / Ss-1) TaxID=665079 RepID=A7F2T3_SCLS1|nr:predicted protein [Sclerotinia sclerotiorum 1980 UF-70]EDN96025.1 predicted protein [Sclerotinia sclerotiorum 1980 UF-70]
MLETGKTEVKRSMEEQKKKKVFTNSLIVHPMIYISV